MLLQQKILAALAGITSRTPMSTDEVRKVVGKERVLTDLEALRDEQKVGHCRVTKGGEATDLWWLAGNIEGAAYVHMRHVPYRKTKEKT